MAKNNTITSHKSLFFRLVADYDRNTVLPARASRLCSVPNVDTGWKHRATLYYEVCISPMR